MVAAALHQQLVRFSPFGEFTALFATIQLTTWRLCSVWLPNLVRLRRPSALFAGLYCASTGASAAMALFLPDLNAFHCHFVSHLLCHLCLRIAGHSILCICDLPSTTVSDILSDNIFVRTRFVPFCSLSTPDRGYLVYWTATYNHLEAYFLGILLGIAVAKRIILVQLSDVMPQLRLFGVRTVIVFSYFLVVIRPTSIQCCLVGITFDTASLPLVSQEWPGQVSTRPGGQSLVVRCIRDDLLPHLHSACLCLCLLPCFHVPLSAKVHHWSAVLVLAHVCAIRSALLLHVLGACSIDLVQRALCPSEPNERRTWCRECSPLHVTFVFS